MHHLCYKTIYIWFSKLEILLDKKIKSMFKLDFSDHLKIKIHIFSLNIKIKSIKRNQNKLCKFIKQETWLKNVPWKERAIFILHIYSYCFSEMNKFLVYLKKLKDLKCFQRLQKNYKVYVKFFFSVLSTWELESCS